METTLVKIDAEDRDIVARIMAECATPCKFYTVEENPLMLLCEIENNNPSILFSLGKMVGMCIINAVTERKPLTPLK